MKPKFITLCTFITALTLAGINTARAADFTFTVPVRLNNLLGEVKEYYVQCNVGESPTDLTIGNGSVRNPVDVNSGNVANPGVTVEVNASSGKDPYKATHYTCEVKLRAGNDGIGAWHDFLTFERQG